MSMEISSANTLECLIDIYGAVRANKFSDELLSEISNDTAYIGSKLNLNPVQCVLLAIILDATYDDRSIDSSKIADRMEMNNIEFRRYRKDLEESDASALAHDYEFSGGQIENVTRKSLINYVIEGKPYNMEDLSKYCDEECCIDGCLQPPMMDRIITTQ